MVKKPPSHNRNAVWLTRPQVVNMFNFSDSTFRSVVVGLLPEHAIRKRGRRFEYEGRALFAVILEWRATDETPATAGDSPNLERLRAARARLAELDVLERERQLIPVDELRDWLSRIAERLRIAADALQKQYGTGAYDIMARALEDMRRLIEGEAKPE